MMKLRIITLLSLLAFAFVGRAENLEDYRKDLFMLDIGVGANVDLSSLSNEQAQVFDKRPSSVVQVSMRPGYFFSTHWGAYADFRFNLFRLREIEKAIDILVPGLSKLKPSVSMGMAYRFERKHLQIQPRLGVGFSSYGNSTRKYKTGKEEMSEEVSGGMWCVDAGVSFAYRTSRVCALFIDLNAMQPFTPAKYSLTKTVDGVSADYSLNSYTWGRTMSISVGVRLQTSGK